VRGKLSASVNAFVAQWQWETCEDALYLPDMGHCGSDLFLMISKTNARDTYSSEKTSSKEKHPITGLEWPRGFQEVKVPRFHDSGTGWW
jgi:hypothetical protein